MKARTRKMQEALDYLNKEEFEQFVEKHEKAHTVEYGNGKRLTAPLNVVVGKIIDDNEIAHKKLNCLDNKVAKILDAIGFYLDARNVIAIVKKHKIITTGIIATLIRLWIG